MYFFIGEKQALMVEIERKSNYNKELKVEKIVLEER